MVLFTTGVPGSGKTYFAVNYLYDTFVNKKSKHFGENVRFFTNINGFIYDQFDNGKELDFDLLLENLTYLYNEKQKGVSDKELLESCKDFGIDNALFVIDECHNQFDEDSKVLVWWLSYHRHLHQNILLITQSLELVNKKYFQFSEFYYQAQASSLRILSFIFRYKVYTSPKLYKKTEVQGFTLRFKKDVYALYHSGANQQSKKVIFYYLAIAAAVFSLFVFGIFFVKSKWTPDQQKNSQPSGSEYSSSIEYVKAPAVMSYRLVCVLGDCLLDGKHRVSIEELYYLDIDFEKDIKTFSDRSFFTKNIIMLDSSELSKLGIR